MALLREGLPVQLPDTALQTGLNMNEDTSLHLEGVLSTILEQAYARGIKAEALTTAEEQVHREINNLYVSNSQKTFLRQLDVYKRQSPYGMFTRRVKVWW